MDEIDPCFRELLRHPRAHIMAPAETADIQDVREAIDAPMRAISGAAVAQVIDLVGDDGQRSVPLRLYRASSAEGLAPIIVFIHGGGFVGGSRDTHDAICRTLCRASGVNLLSVEYRLAPEHPYPAALDDCCTVLLWISKEGERLGMDPAQIALCGDSAGGYLAVSSALAMRDQPFDGEIRHIGLLYPVVDPSCNTPSMEAFAEGYMLTRGALQWFWRAFSNSKAALETELSLLKRDLSGLPAVSIVTAGFDPLRDEGGALYERLKQAGVATSLRCYLGMVHGFASLINLTELAADAIHHLAAEINDSFGCQDQAAFLPTNVRQKVAIGGALSLDPANMAFREERARLL